MTYIVLYKLCERHNIQLIEQGGWMKFFYDGKLCGVVSTQVEHKSKVMWASAKEGLVAHFMRQLTGTTLKKRGAR